MSTFRATANKELSFVNKWVSAKETRGFFPFWTGFLIKSLADASRSKMYHGFICAPAKSPHISCVKIIKTVLDIL